MVVVVVLGEEGEGGRGAAVAGMFGRLNGRGRPNVCVCIEYLIFLVHAFFPYCFPLFFLSCGSTRYSNAKISINSIVTRNTLHYSSIIIHLTKAASAS